MAEKRCSISLSNKTGNVNSAGYILPQSYESPGSEDQTGVFYLCIPKISHNLKIQVVSLCLDALRDTDQSPLQKTTMPLTSTSASFFGSDPIDQRATSRTFRRYGNIKWGLLTGWRWKTGLKSKVVCSCFLLRVKGSFHGDACLMSAESRSLHLLLIK